MFWSNFVSFFIHLNDPTLIWDGRNPDQNLNNNDDRHTNPRQCNHNLDFKLCIYLVYNFQQIYSSVLQIFLVISDNRCSVTSFDLGGNDQASTTIKMGVMVAAMLLLLVYFAIVVFSFSSIDAVV